MRHEKAPYTHLRPVSFFFGALICILTGMSAAQAAPPSCQVMMDKATNKFEAVKKMAGPSAAKCQALSLLISDLQDIAQACGLDGSFINEKYKPLATAVGKEAPTACQR